MNKHLIHILFLAAAVGLAAVVLLIFLLIPWTLAVS